MKKPALFFACCFLLLAGILAGAAQAREITGKLYIASGMGGTEGLAPAEVSALPENSPEVVLYFKSKHRHIEVQKDNLASTLAARQRDLTDSFSGGPPDPKVMDAAKKGYQEVFEALKLWAGPSYYFKELPPQLAAASTKTDADGKFRLAVPPGKYVIAAAANRADNKGGYYWLVRVDATTEDQSVILSNENLFETNCAACFQPGRMPGN